MSFTKIYLASDHGGVSLKAAIKAHLEAQSITVTDLGPFDDSSVDYPDFGKKMGDAIASGDVQSGIIICGTGIGISIAANRNPAVRCGLCTDTTMARLTREHNDANVLAIGARITGVESAMDIVDVFLNTEFEGGRHARRVEKLG